ncbi:MAG: hypothetical protein OEN22_09780 [Gammaproteobacteria bacterium]|nr:hypothetical protein [Gammaproteobacteria bacterium]
MFKAVRISVLLFVLIFVVVNTWLSQARSTDWNNSLWIKVYPINADGSDTSFRYIESLSTEDFHSIETFIAREASRYGKVLNQPLRVELGNPIVEQPPALDVGAGVFGVMLWSLKMRWWASSIAKDQDSIDPDVRIFVRYYQPEHTIILENSVGLQKGMVGVVNAYASRHQQGSNNFIIAHEFLHTLGATDKYNPADGSPRVPEGLAEPDLKPLYPQRFAEIMGGRIALAGDDAVVPKSLKYAVIGPVTAREIRLIE